ncbi:crotonobetainyl-CoA:carnitine CoA-transferase [compost metagenome]
MEQRFYAELLQRLGLDASELPAQYDRSGWPVLRQRFEAVFQSRTRDEWCAAFEGSDACVAPVLEFSEAPQHPHHRARGSFIEVDGVVQPAPAPRFLGTPSEVVRSAPARGQHGAAALRDWGFDDDGIAQLQAMGLGMLAAS